MKSGAARSRRANRPGGGWARAPGPSGTDASDIPPRKMKTAWTHLTERPRHHHAASMGRGIINAAPFTAGVDVMRRIAWALVAAGVVAGCQGGGQEDAASRAKSMAAAKAEAPSERLEVAGRAGLRARAPP